MSTSPKEIDRTTRVVAGVQVRITEWADSDGQRLWIVHRVDTGDDLTAHEYLDNRPTDEQITHMLDRQPGMWTCRGCGTQIEDTHADLVVEHVLIHCDLVDGAGNPIRGTS